MQSFEKFPSSSINLEEYLSFPLDQSLPEKTALLNEINRELTQIKECSLLLEKELKQFPMDSHNLQIKIRETEEKQQEIEYKIEEIEEKKENNEKRRLLIDKEEEFLEIERQLNQLQMDKKQQSSFLSSLQQDYHSQKNIYSQNLSSLQAQKTALNQDLTQKIEKLTQLLEKKAMTKEDLNGKLLQRAESIAQREELELFLESRQYEDYIAYENMKHFFEKEFDLQKEREILTFEKINKENDYKRRENELMEKEEEFFTWNQKKLKLLDDRMKKLNENNELNENIEEELNKKAGQLKLPELEAFFQFLSKKFENFLENVVLKRQLSLIEEETLKLKGFSIDKGILKEKRDIRLKEIENWKEKAISFFKKNEDKSKEKNGFDVYNLENFERFLDEKAEQAGINLEDRRYQGFKQDVFQYFESLERQEKDLKEIDKVESICILNIETLHPLLEKLQKEKSIVQNTLEDMDIYLSSILLKGQLLENEKNSYQKIVDSFILKQAEVAFQSYLNEQSETFTKIAKTYGKNAAITLEKQHHKQFLEIYKGSHLEKLEQYYQANKTLKKLEFQIDYNMNNVDNAIIPNLKEIVLKIADLKKTIGLLQTKQGKLVEEEDRLLNELDGLQNSFRSRITNVYENEQEDFPSKEKEFCYLQFKLQDIKEEINRNFQDVQYSCPTEEDSLPDIESLSQDLFNMKESLYKYKVLLQKFNEKTSQLQLIQDKSTQLHRKKNFLQRQINIFLSDIDEVSKQRAVSAPKKRENLDLSSMNKTQNDYLLTDRSIINQTNKNRQKNEKSILHDMTIKKHDLNLGDCSIKNQSKYNNCNNNKECPRHQKAYKFNLEEASTKEIELFDNIKPLLEGLIVYKKFTHYQSLKQPIFNPANEDLMPENCGYGFRMVSLNIFSEKLEFKSQGKIIESSIRLEQILKTQISQISLDMIKASKKITQEQLKNKTRQKKTFLPFALILEERGRVELIARSEKDLENFVNGVNALLQVKKELEFLKDKIEVNCNCN